MFDSCTIRGIPFTPARFCAPLAGITHSAFRRLVADFGGHGALFTEMLAAHHILSENLHLTPALRRRPREGRVIYQLMFREGDPVEHIIARLVQIQPDGIDLNLACHAPNIRFISGSRMFEDTALLLPILREVRRCWPGLLTVKVRLGSDQPAHAQRFAERMHIFEQEGVDAVILHPRFFEDRFKRRARHELYAWAASLTALPIIANGDITGAASTAARAGELAPVRAVMIGRMAVVQPWLFAAWDQPVLVDHAEVWRRFVTYVCDDFPVNRAFARIKIFSEYYARNFKFGHAFYTAIQNAPSIAVAQERADRFFDAAPELVQEPTVAGL